jgi:collagenase-like PrtC family protease
MVRHLDCELELLANEMCLYGCPHRGYHYDLMAHASQGGASLADIEYPHLMCSTRRMANPAELLKARFIRPEDVARYEALGLGLIKLAGRGRDSEGLLRAARAYLGRRYDGNLLDITDLGFFDAPGVPRPELVVDNRALDGFLDRVGAVDCDQACGSTCSICDVLAKDIVRVRHGEAYAEGLVRSHDRLVRNPKTS